MKLLTKDIAKKLPELYTTENVATQNKMIQVKYFCPWNSWTWYGVEFNPETNTFFGFVEGIESEWGYFSLNELQNVTHNSGLKIERDMYFQPKLFKEL
tara:strand:+ start:2589 stop:2882 length:294 start_codon:yes stop_codon:yes gene_type:complete